MEYPFNKWNILLKNGRSFSFNKWKILLKKWQFDSFLNDCTFVHKEQEQQQQRRSMDLRGEARGQKQLGVNDFCTWEEKKFWRQDEEAWTLFSL